MSEICTLEEVKHHLRYDSDDSDMELSIYLDAAENVVLNYVDAKWQQSADLPDAFKIAVLLLVGYYDNNRNAEGTQKMLPTVDVAYVEGNYMTTAVRSILLPYRTLVAV